MPPRRPTRRQLLAGACALALAGCAAPDRPRARGRSVPIVYDEHGGLFVDARVGGRPPVRFVLDTGSSRSTLSAAYAAELGLRMRDGGEVEGTAGVVSSSETTAELHVPGLAPLELDFLVYPFGSYDPACVGILGHEVLSREPFRIVYGEGRLVWSPSEPPRTLAMEVDGRIPRIEARANGVPLAFRIDTGATLAPSPAVYVNLAPGQAERLGLDRREPERVFTATGTGGATLELPVHRLESFALGPRAFPEAYAIVQPAVGYFARPDAVGFVGNSVLEKLDPTLDYERGLFGF